MHHQSGRRVYGKIIGGLLGLLGGGFFGLLIGALVGHFFDRGLFQLLKFASPRNLARVRDSFFDTTFLLAGHLAKADGRVSEAEVAHAEQLFVQLGMNAEQKRRAIARFKEGAAPGFSIDQAVKSFIDTCGRQQQLIQTMLLFLISQAHADSQMDGAERQVLAAIAKAFGVNAAQLARLVDMARAQQQFHSGGQGQPQSSQAPTPDAAYAALGVDPSVDDKTLKRAYRKLMSENHPDKLIAKGVPESMIKVATERSQEIQNAYEVIKQQRGLAR